MTEVVYSHNGIDRLTMSRPLRTRVTYVEVAFQSAWYGTGLYFTCTGMEPCDFGFSLGEPHDEGELEANNGGLSGAKVIDMAGNAERVPLERLRPDRTGTTRRRSMDEVRRSRAELEPIADEA